MSELRPDLLRIEVEKEDEVYADRVDLHVLVKGSSVFSGAAATKNAKEVNQLVEALTDTGVTPEDVFVQSVHAEVQSGLLTRSSSAEYRLRIRIGDLSFLPEIIERAGTRKNVTLQYTEWRYDGLDAVMSSWLATLLQQANEKAALVARSLGVNLGGVHHFEEQRFDPDRPPPTVRVQHGFDEGAPLAASMRARAGSSGALGFEVAHSKRVRLVAVVDYRVSPRV